MSYFRKIKAVRLTKLDDHGNPLPDSHVTLYGPVYVEFWDEHNNYAYYGGDRPPSACLVAYNGVPQVSETYVDPPTREASSDAEDS